MVRGVKLITHLLLDKRLGIIVDSRPLPHTAAQRAERQLYLGLLIFKQICGTAHMIGVRHE